MTVIWNNRVKFVQIAAAHGSFYALDTDGWVWLWIQGSDWMRIESPVNTYEMKDNMVDPEQVIKDMENET